ncbi:hook-length control protein FliK [Caldanaerovirga acetigignens]|uniref:Hook-length control protein FliK n=1 Tax=Caldanaerovirga acetigignens TaxID=447595 RepID=A0A1M7G3A6_9FIRM|nr:flagellar hook-length control protein FliK [Caldanaerovirga acetigignens]SHM10635.1 hook-length control protein FliK [Caldanaerovirga acetigignens]
MTGQIVTAISAPVIENKFYTPSQLQKAKIAYMEYYSNFDQLLELLLEEAKNVEGSGKDDESPDNFVLLMQLLNLLPCGEKLNAIKLELGEPDTINNEAAEFKIAEIIGDKAREVNMLLDSEKRSFPSPIEVPKDNTANAYKGKNEVIIVNTKSTLMNNSTSYENTRVSNAMKDRAVKQKEVPKEIKLMNEKKGEILDFEKVVMEKDGQRVSRGVPKVPEINVETFEIILQIPSAEKTNTINVVFEKNEKLIPDNYKEKILFIKDAIFDELVEKVQVAVKEGSMKEIKIKIKPEYLGEMMVRIAQDKGEVKAEFFVKNAIMKELLQSSIQEIKGQMAKQGYELSDIKIYDFPMQFDMRQQGEKYENDRYNNSHYRKVLKTSEGVRGMIEKPIGEVTQDKALYGISDGFSIINYIV